MSDSGFEPRLIGFLCRWCSYNGADLAGTARLKYPPNMVPIKTNCSGRVDPTHIMKAFAEGADGVIIAGCHPGDCHYINGNYRTAGRYPLMEKLLEQLGLEHGRVRLEWVSAAEGDKFARVVSEFTEEIRALGPLGWSEQFKDEAAAVAPEAVTGMSKFKFAMYWAGSCGGCEIALLEIKEKIIEVDQNYDVVFWPAAADFKYKDLEAYDDGFIDVCLFNGCVRNSENEHIANVLRAKSKVLVAFGACATMGGIPGLANLAERPGDQGPRLHAEPVGRQPRQGLPAGAPHGARGRARPAAHVRHRQDARPDRRRRLLHARLPARSAPDRRRARRRHRRPQGRGCAAGQGRDHRRRAQVVLRRMQARQRRKEDRRLQAHLGVPPRSREVPARAGRHLHGPGDRRRLRGALHQRGHACRGCYGPPEGVVDQGAKMLSTLASIVDAPDPDEIARIAATVPDPVGTFYRFGLASSLLRRARV